MVFSSIGFIGIFLPIVLFIYLLIGKKLRLPVLLISSLVFYGIGEPRCLIILLTSLAINYFFGGLISELGKSRKIVFIIVLVWNFGVLFFFKYFGFFVQNVNVLVGKEIIPVIRLTLPLGISFYTFQMTSYQIDVYRGVQEKCSNFFEFCVYVCFFPQLIAGPIVRYEEMEKYIKKPAVRIENIEAGLKIFTFGLGLKVLLANQIGTLFQSIQNIGSQNLDASVAWLGAFSYSFQIYFDFWGYSLMAIGLGSILGYRLPENFNNPYMAKSATDFWRRWHITLSRWFREYVYIPLGGNRKGKVRTYLNLLLVWSLTGLWHGASWNFVLWGLFFFCLIAIEKNGLGDFLEKSKLIGHLYCLFLIPVSWIIFSQTELASLAAYLRAMLFMNFSNALVGAVQLFRYLKEYGVLLIVCVICTTPLPVKLFAKYNKNVIGLLLLFAIFWFSIYELYIGKNNPFLYFRF